MLNKGSLPYVQSQCYGTGGFAAKWLCCIQLSEEAKRQKDTHIYLPNQLTVMGFVWGRRIEKLFDDNDKRGVLGFFQVVHLASTQEPCFFAGGIIMFSERVLNLWH